MTEVSILTESVEPDLPEKMAPALLQPLATPGEIDIDKIDIPHERLGDRLIKAGLITPLHMETALAEQRVTKERLGTILIRNGFVGRKVLMEILSGYASHEIRNEQHFTTSVPADLLIALETVIIAETSDEVFLASPLPESIIRRELQPYYPGHTLQFSGYNHEKLDEYLIQLSRSINDGDSLMEQILRRGLAEGVSDIHIIPRHSSYTIMFRHLGRRRPVHEGDFDEYNTLVARIKDLSRMDIAERRLPQDGAFSFEYNSRQVDFRVATVPVGNLETVVMRILDAESVQTKLDLLGISRLEEWRKGVSHSNGICLVCGPTGSGKSTTLLSTIREMDRFGKSVNTLEDPVEYRIPFVNQVAINDQIGLTFAKGLRAFMRLDPDIIVVGEIRDHETAENAVRAAETGHLVLATLHTESIIGSFARLRHLGVSEHDLTSLLRSVLVQNLFRTTCKACGGKGCPACRQTGYAGRTVVSECNYFRNEAEVTRMARGECWWPTLVEDVYEKVQQGLSDKAEAIRDYGEAYIEICKQREVSAAPVSAPAIPERALPAPAEEAN